MRRTMTAVLVAGLLLGAAACGSSDDGASGGAAAAAEQTSEAASPASQPAGGSSIAPADRAAYLAYLGKVDPGLVVNEERAIRRGRDTCLDMKQGMEGAKLVDRVSQRFTGGNATVDAAKARKVIKAAKRWICK